MSTVPWVLWVAVSTITPLGRELGHISIHMNIKIITNAQQTQVLILKSSNATSPLEVLLGGKEQSQ